MTEGVGSIFLPIAFRDAYGLVVLVAILLFKPSGLFGDEMSGAGASCGARCYALPLFVKSDFILTILVFTFLLGMLAVSFNLIFGFTGQLSMFHAAAFGISAYATYLVDDPLGKLPFWVGMLPRRPRRWCSPSIVGSICFRFRLKKFYFAVVTLAFSEMARLVVLNWNSVTNGTLGIILHDKPTIWLPGKRPGASRGHARCGTTSASSRCSSP